MEVYAERPRPGVLTAVAILSLIWSAVTVIRIILWTLIALLAGASTWLLGPAVGALGSVVALAFIALMVLRSFLSIVLFVAAWHTFTGDPQGRELHKIWAWLNIGLDLISLALTWGISPASWWGLAYACAILYIMDLPEVRSYFGRRHAWPPKAATPVVGGGEV